jgi:hypothetical protein
MQKPSPLQSVITFIGLILLINCGGPSQPDESETDLLEQAWSLYHNDDWSASLTSFSDLLATGNVTSEAYTGMGYCQLHLHLPQEAAQSFQEAVSLNSWLVDSRAGLIFAERELESVDYEALRVEAASLIHINPNWIFVHEPEINWRDLMLVRAQCSFYLGDFQTCLQVLVSINPDLSLSESDPDSWVPWPTFTEALLHTLEEYSLLYGDS